MSTTTEKSDSDICRFPAPLQNLIRKAASANGDDIDRAVTYSYKKLVKMSIYDNQLKEDLIRYALRKLVNDARSTTNKQLKKKWPYDFSKVKHNQITIASPSKAMASTYDRWFDYRIAGRTLGSLMGSELQGIADFERKISDGHIKNAEMLDALIPLVPPNQTVKQALSPKQLGKIAKKYLKAA